MTNLRFAKGGAVALISAATVLVTASCTSGLADNQDTTGQSGGAPNGFGTGGVISNPTGGSAPFGTGGQVGTGGSTSSTGGSHTGGVSSGSGGAHTGGFSNAGNVSTGGTNTGGGASGTGGTNSIGGTSSSNCSDLPPNNGDTCAHAVEYGWCSQDWLGTSCQRSCGKCSGGSGGSTSTGGNSSGKGGSTNTGGNSSSKGGSNSTGGTTNTTGGSNSTGGNGNVTHPPPITGGSSAWASRYWDCCKPACGWSGNVRSGNAMPSCGQQNQSLGATDAKNACESGGTAFMCWNGVPWAVSDTLSYGFAAASGNNYVCGRCFQIQFNGTGHNGNNPGAQSLNGKTMIIQVINNGGVANDQFDLLIPGGGVGQLNACDTQWGGQDLGAQYGGFLAGCNGDKNCVRTKCQTVFAGKPDLMAGCDWFLGWFNAADNPNLVYKQIACPAAITQRSGLGDPG